ncbi:MAG: alpha-amylase family protein [Dysgonamonadaceae bacterium]|jgi:glycosidase|nr:alpha-amylase family protein [Dysgonamonadaceae bacterium]
MKKEEKMVIYQVLPRLFGNDRSSNVINGSMEENGCGKMSDFTDKALQSIKTMGVTHVWYTGLMEHATQTDYSAFGIKKDHPAIVKGKAGSPYAVKDYYDVSPDLANDVENRMNELEELVNRTHKAGMKVIIDFVPNHVAREYHSDSSPDGCSDLGAEDNNRTTFASDNNFYYIPGQVFTPDFPIWENGNAYHEFPAKATGNDCFNAHPSRNDWYETVKLNYGIDYLNGKQTHFDPVPNTWNKMTDILLFWASKKIDGFRCDMAEMVPVEFWSYSIPRVKEKYPDTVFIAEIYNPSQYRNFLYNGHFDYLYDKVGLYDTLRAIIAGFQPAHRITSCWQSADDIQPRMLNFLENHDEQRIASSFFAGDPRKAVPALAVASLMNTNPFMLYFGQELGEKGMDAEGFSGRDGRTSIFDYWSLESVRNWRDNGEFTDRLLTSGQKELRKCYAKILSLCNGSVAVRQGLFYDLMYANFNRQDFNPDRQFAFMRYCKNELLLIVANFDSCDVDISVFLPAHTFDYFGIDESQITQAKDLLLNKKLSPEIKRDTCYQLHIQSHNAAIVKFLFKK